MSDLHYGVRQALGDAVDDYDIDAIAEELADSAATAVDDVPGEEFWEIVERHQVPEISEETPEESFRAEVERALARQRPAGEPTVWQRGGVTMRIIGASRVAFPWPQPGAGIEIVSITGEEVHLFGESVTWSGLWSAVHELLESWTAAVAERRAEYETAHAAAERAEAQARKAAATAARAQEALNVLLPPDGQVSSTMSKADVADYLGIAPGSVRKQMSRWSIAPTYERGRSGRAEARYPTAEVQAAASRRPGRGHRTDLA